MKKSMWIVSIWFSLSVVPAIVFGQAFGEYGRAVGSIPRGKGVTGPRAPGSVTQGTGGSGGVGEIGGRVMPARLVVAAKSAGLHTRQDEESETIAQLSEGESLVPMVQAEGAIKWYMVKTPRGLIGWVKTSDVRPVTIKK